MPRKRGCSMAKMNKRVKKLWIEALKSGEYVQGMGALRQGKDFCCLGVLCDLHALELRQSWSYGVYFGSDTTLPQEVTGWAELGSDDPVIGTKGTAKRLTTLNDSYGKSAKTFEQIANLIQRYL